MSELINNRAHRLRLMKEIIRQLHAGTPPADVKADLKELIQQADSSEITAMEQELLAEGMSVEEIMGMCDLHHQVLAEILQPTTIDVPPGHPVDTLQRENEALKTKVADLRAILDGIAALAEGAAAEELILSLRGGLNDLMDVEKHYQRKENLIFSVLERHGISGPAKVMWGKHDEAREFLKALREALQIEGVGTAEWQVVASEVGLPVLDAVAEMVAKAENILFPMRMENSTAEEWSAVWRPSPQYGWCLVEPREGYSPPAPEVEIPGDAHDTGSVSLPTGVLRFAELQSIFANLPVDVTFVDAEDRVRFFSEGRSRVFPRSPAIIGRHVQHCHPPKSVHVVEQILADFRTGKQDLAEFWIELQGRFIHIRYYALRDPEAGYLGTLEVTQDATDLRALAGERRLLQYDQSAE